MHTTKRRPPSRRRGRYWRLPSWDTQRTHPCSAASAALRCNPHLDPCRQRVTQDIVGRRCGGCLPQQRHDGHRRQPVRVRRHPGSPAPTLGPTGVTSTTPRPRASYQVRFSGTQVKVYPTKAPRHGIQAVLDRRRAGGDGRHRIRRAAHQVLVVHQPRPRRRDAHVEVRVTGTKNGSASDSFVVADRVDVTLSTAPPPPPPPPADAGTFNDATTGTAANQFEFVGSLDRRRRRSGLPG